MLDNQSMFVILRTVEELQAFWNEYKSVFKYAARNMGHDSNFLREDEWVFGITKISVVQTVLRWRESGIRCEFYDWAKDQPEWHRDFFRDRELIRDSKLKDGSWTQKDQRSFEQKTPENYRGWWILANIPGGYDHGSWFTVERDEINDSAATPIEVIERMLQEQTFDEWHVADLPPVRACAWDELPEFMEDWMDHGGAGIERADMVVPGGCDSEREAVLSPVGFSTDVVEDDEDAVIEAVLGTPGDKPSRSASPFLTLDDAVETIASELEMMLDHNMDGVVARIVDAHNLGALKEAIGDATAALERLIELKVEGSREAAVAFRAFATTVSGDDVLEIREACEEIDADAYLSDYVIGVMPKFKELLEAEEKFDMMADERRAFPAGNAG